MPNKNGVLQRCALLIPHYRNVTGLMRSLASIGTDETVDVFIVDDGSELCLDEKGLASVFRAMGTVTFIYLPGNQGIAHALNAGLAKIGQQYEYIARLDCGDVCAPDRFQRQMAFLDQHPAVALLGTAVTFVDQRGESGYTLRLPASAALIRRAMHNNCAFIHPTVMWRSCVMVDVHRYPVDYPMAEDFAFFWLFVQRFATANLPEVLVWAEINPNGLSIRQRQQQLRSRLRLQWHYCQWDRYSLYGMLKTVLLMIVPYRWVLKLKRQRMKK